MTNADDASPVHSRPEQSVFDEKEILHDFPVSLQQEVMLHSNKHLISIFPVLQSTASGFLMLVTSAMRAALYSKGDVVCLEGELGKCMYFVASGQTYAWVKKSMTLDRRTTEEKREEKNQGNISRLVSKLSIIMEKEDKKQTVTDQENSKANAENESTVGFCFCGEHFGEAELLDTKNQFRYLSWTAFSNAEIHTLDKETLRRGQQQFPKEYNKLVMKSIEMQELFTHAIQSVIHCEGKLESCNIVLGSELVPVPRLPKKAYDKVLESFNSAEFAVDGPPLRGRRESRLRNQPVSFTGGILSSFQNGINRGFSLMGVKKSREDRKNAPIISPEEADFLKTTMYYDSLFEESARQTNSSGSHAGYRHQQNKFKHQLEANLPTSDGGESDDANNSLIVNLQDSEEDGPRFSLMGIMLPLHPFEKFRLTWDLLLGIIILYNVITIPVRIAFDLQLTLEDNSFNNMLLVVLEIGFDLMFIMDIFLNFVTAYYKVDVLITNFHSIAIRYASTWLLLDIVASVPFDLILMLADGGDSSGGGVFSSVKMLKTLRVARALKLFRARRLLALLSELEDHLGISSSAFTMMKLGIQISLAGHLMGCAFYLVSDKEWLHSAGVQIGSDVKDRYIASLYWAFTTMTTVGYGDIVFSSQYGYLFGVFSMLVGSLIFSFVIGNFSTMAMQMNRSALQFQKKMDKLNEYMHERNLPHRLRHLCRRYLLDMNANMMAMDEQVRNHPSPLPPAPTRL